MLFYGVDFESRNQVGNILRPYTFELFSYHWIEASECRMNWKYWIMHKWTDERIRWGEAFILPEDTEYDGDALWITIDCIGTPDDHVGHQEIAWYEEAKTKLGSKPYCLCYSDELGDTDLLVNARDFTKGEFLYWIKVWLLEQGINADKLISASLDDFLGRHEHADFMYRIIQRYGKHDTK